MAHIVLSAAEVIKAAEDTIKAIEAARNERNAKMIERCQNAGTIQWLPFPKFRKKTKDEAIRALLGVTFGDYPSYYAYSDYEHAKKLLLLARHGDPVTLNEMDVAVLFFE